MLWEILLHKHEVNVYIATNVDECWMNNFFKRTIFVDMDVDP